MPLNTASLLTIWPFELPAKCLSHLCCELFANLKWPWSQSVVKLSAHHVQMCRPIDETRLHIDVINVGTKI